MKKILNFLDKYKYIFIPGLIGAFAFIFIYGIEVLNPTNTDWMLMGGDNTQHYLGWEIFRNSPWTFPIGMNTIINHPFDISVIYTDSIPLFAIFFKLFSNILPEYFQYFGIYGMLCFVLQGAMAGIVLKKFIKNDYLIILCSLFFIISPVMMQRMYYHTALSSHYIILIGIALILYKDSFNWKKTILLWGLYGMLCGSIHMYFLLFGGMLVVGYMLYELLTTRDIKKIIFSLLAYLLFAAGTVYILGGFSSPVSPFGRESIGTFNFNLNGFFNAYDGYSIYFEKLPLADGLLQEEGFSYLGLGSIIAFVIALISMVIATIYRLITKKKMKFNIKAIIVFIILGLTSIFVASANRIYFGNTLLLEFEVPQFIHNIIGVFRSNGRFCWLCYYIIMFGSFYILYKNVHKEIFVILVVILFGIQVSDMNDALKYKYINADDQVFESNVKDERWELLFNEDFKHVVYISEFNYSSGDKVSIDLIAMKHNKTINRFYIAQGLLYDISEESAVQSFLNPSNENLYLIDQASYLKYKDLNSNLNLYIMDGVYIATYLELNYLDKLQSNEFDVEVGSFMDIKLFSDRRYSVTITGLEELNEFDIDLRDIQYELIDNSINVIVEGRDELNINSNGKVIRVQIEELGDIYTEEEFNEGEEFNFEWEDFE